MAVATKTRKAEKNRIHLDEARRIMDGLDEPEWYAWWKNEAESDAENEQ